MDDAYALIAIGICIFIFLAVLLAIGSFYGGDMNVIALGVTKAILLIMGFAYGCIIIVRLMKH